VAFDSQAREIPAANAATLNNLTATIRSGNAKGPKQLHQLPPILQVTMVAIDEASAQKLEDYSDQPQDFMSGIFQKVGKYSDFLSDLGDPAKPGNDSLIYRLSNPDHQLPTPRMNYRVFTTDVVLRGSKWSK
jgi:uncharacterized protein (TIGR02599 family)